MAIEIEKKFLLKNDSWRKNASGTVYRQGYLSTSKEKTIRVRISARDAFITIKGPVQGISRLEFEYKIPAEDAVQLMELCQNQVIEKTRYVVMYKGSKWEIDEFQGANKGLVLAEIELPREDQVIDFPDWIGEEVTGNPDYYNANLTHKPFTTW